ncbi:unnamed protein product, partial [Musa hybrid cultivar]
PLLAFPSPVVPHSLAFLTRSDVASSSGRRGRRLRDRGSAGWSQRIWKQTTEIVLFLESPHHERPLPPHQEVAGETDVCQIAVLPVGVLASGSDRGDRLVRGAGDGVPDDHVHRLRAGSPSAAFLWSGTSDMHFIYDEACMAG